MTIILAAIGLLGLMALGAHVAIAVKVAAQEAILELTVIREDVGPKGLIIGSGVELRH